MAIRFDKLRLGILVCSTASAFALSACAFGQDPGQSSAPEKNAQAPSAADAVETPKDPGSIPPCELLPDQGAESLGLLPQGRATEGSFGSDAKDTCFWGNADGSITSSLGILSDRTIKDYDQPDAYIDFEKLTISGHPAVRANQGDPKADGMCVFFLASNSGQLVQSTAQVPSSETNVTDPCDLAKKTLESAVPSWPAAK